MAKNGWPRRICPDCGRSHQCITTDSQMSFDEVPDLPPEQLQEFMTGSRVVSTGGRSIKKEGSILRILRNGYCLVKYDDGVQERTQIKFLDLLE